MNIGAAAKASGVTAKMIRHYESIGLITNGERSISGYRTFTEFDLHGLRFIKRARSLGFSLQETSKLLSLWHDKNRASADVKKLAQIHIDDLDKKLREITEMRNELKRLMKNCHGDSRPDCPILEGMQR